MTRTSPDNEDTRRVWDVVYREALASTNDVVRSMYVADQTTRAYVDAK